MWSASSTILGDALALERRDRLREKVRVRENDEERDNLPDVDEDRDKFGARVAISATIGELGISGVQVRFPDVEDDRERFGVLENDIALERDAVLDKEGVRGPTRVEM